MAVLPCPELGERDKYPIATLPVAVEEPYMDPAPTAVFSFPTVSPLRA
jgi:hypothetical protein